MNVYSLINSVVALGARCRILDFGCGCGRVIRYFHKLSTGSSLYGTDIDTEATSWCQECLSHIGEFTSNDVAPPLPFDAEFFDCIYSVSIFTHLPEDMQFAWLEELRRVTKRGGYLLLTTHGEELFRTTSKEKKDQLRREGFYYSVGAGTEGLPDFYQGLANHQDLILCRRPALEGA